MYGEYVFRTATIIRNRTKRNKKMARHTPRRRQSGNFPKALILAVILVFSFYMYSRISKDGVPRQFLDIFDEGQVDFTKLEQFSETERDSIRRAIAGFWTYESDSAAPLYLRDRIELKDNGIIWRVTQYQLITPRGEIDAVTHIQHAYLNPYALTGKKPSHMYAEVRIIRQAYIFDKDTCYGQSHEDQVWELQATAEEFGMLGRSYGDWGERDLALFFPAGAIDIIDQFELDECPTGYSAPILLRGAIIGELVVDTVATRDSSLTYRLATDYYTDLCLIPQFGGKTFTSDTAGPLFTAEYRIDWKGEPRDVSLSTNKIGTSKSLLGMLKREIELWRFRPLDAEAPSMQITHAFRLN